MHPGMSEILMSDQTPADDGAADDPIAAGRARIDELDEQIVALVLDRIAVSRGIQQARIASGGRRVEHGRELQILERYSRELGQQGTALAMLLLEICRGKRLSG